MNKYIPLFFFLILPAFALGQVLRGDLSFIQKTSLSTYCRFGSAFNQDTSRCFPVALDAVEKVEQQQTAQEKVVEIVRNVFIPTASAQEQPSTNLEALIRRIVLELLPQPQTIIIQGEKGEKGDKGDPGTPSGSSVPGQLQAFSNIPMPFWNGAGASGGSAPSMGGITSIANQLTYATGTGFLTSDVNGSVSSVDLGAILALGVATNNIFATNGLSLIATTTVGLGGILTQNTAIDRNNFTLNLTNGLLNVTGTTTLERLLYECSTSTSILCNNGNMFGGLATLGTNDANGLGLKTNGLERIRITDTGNVGIGNNAPQNILEITATTSNASGLRLTNLLATSPVATTSNKALTVNTVGDIVLSQIPGTENVVDFSVNANPNTGGTAFSPNTPNDTNIIYSSTIDNSLWKYNGSIYVTHTPTSNNWTLVGNVVGTTTRRLGTTDNFPLPFITNNLERMRIDVNGRVGIGTTIPLSNLHLAVPNAAVDGTKGVRISNPAGTVVMLESGAANDSYVGTLSASSFGFRTNNVLRAELGINGNFAVDTNTLFVDAVNNRVSVGNTAPSSLFHISVPAVAVNSVNGIRLENSAGTLVMLENGVANDSYVGTVSGSSFSIRTSNTPRIIVGGINGNVGINTPLPTERLDITGNIRFSGALMPNNLAGATGTVLISQGVGLAPIWGTPSAFIPTAVNSNVSVNTVLSGTDDQFQGVNTTSGNIIITLPAAANREGQMITIFKTATANQIDVNRVGGDSINFAPSTYPIRKQAERVTFVSDGVNNWQTIAQEGDFMGTDGLTAGERGLVPTPGIGDLGKVLSANGQWVATSTLGIACLTCFQQNGNSFGTTTVIGTNDLQNFSFETNNTQRANFRADNTFGLELFNLDTTNRYAYSIRNTANNLNYSLWDGLTQDWLLGFNDNQFLVIDRTDNRDMMRITKGSAYTTVIGDTAVPSSNTVTLLNNNIGYTNTTFGVNSGRKFFITDGTTVRFWVKPSNVLATDTTNYESLVVADNDIPNRRFVFNNFFAQNGNAFGGLATIGTTDNNSVRLIASSSEVMRVTSDGNVGIGTSSPLTKMHVLSGNVNGLTLQTTANAALLDFRTTGVTPANRNWRLINNFSTGGTLEIHRSSDAISAPSIVTARFTSSGNFGLNVNPGSLLSVNGNAAIGGTGYSDVAAPANGLIVQGNTGIGTSSPLFLLHVGSASITSGVTVARFENAGGTCDVTPNVAGGITCTSDQNLKKDIESIDPIDSLQKLLAVEVKSYRMNADTSSSTRQTGFLAQQLETQFPGLVLTSVEGTKSVSYAGMTPILTQAVQTLYRFMSDIGVVVEGGVAKINSFFAKEVKSERLCVVDADGETCISRAQLNAIIQQVTMVADDVQVYPDNQNTNPISSQNQGEDNIINISTSSEANSAPTSQTLEVQVVQVQASEDSISNTQLEL